MVTQGHRSQQAVSSVVGYELGNSSREVEEGGDDGDEGRGGERGQTEGTKGEGGSAQTTETLDR